MSVEHKYLKVEEEYFKDIASGVKTFEIRRNDRDYQVGDIVLLNEVVNGSFTGRKLPPKEITYIFHGGRYGLEEGYCVFGIKDMSFG